MKKFLAIVLALCMVCSLCAVSASADDTIKLKMHFVDPETAPYVQGGLKIADWYAEDARKEAEAKAKAEEAAKQPGYVEKTNKDLPFPYHISLVEEKDAEKKAAPGKDDYVLGVRPEMIEICEAGGIEAEIYSAMPTGMETTVRLKVGNFLLTGVVFGGVTYEIGSRVRIRFKDNGVILFSRSSGRIIENGSLRLR